MLSRTLRFPRDNGGLSAIEFALIAPVLAFMVLALADAVNFAVSYTSMQRAERAGIQYFMNGGTSASAAQGIVGSVWTNPPANYSVNAQEVCTCPGNGQAVTCGQGCTNGSKSTETMTITASATVGGILTSLPESKSEVVRVQ